MKKPGEESDPEPAPDSEGTPPADKTRRTKDDGGEGAAAARHRYQHLSLLRLHWEAGTLGNLELSDELAMAGFRRTHALDHLARGVAQEEVPHSAILDALRALARSGWVPESDDERDSLAALALQITDTKDLEPAQLLDDIWRAALDEAPFLETASGGEFQAEAQAFSISHEDVCDIHRVIVRRNRAVWIYSEFLTDAPFDQAAQFVNPDNWTTMGPLLFKKMEVVGQKTNISGPDHWHAKYFEEVQLLQRLKTYLHVDYYRRADEVAGMTYLLDDSVGDDLSVDRGFLLVNQFDGKRRVKALKIVGFLPPEWNRVALWSCVLGWTDFMKRGIEGSSLEPDPSNSFPGSGAVTLGGVFGDWLECLGDATKNYGQSATSAANRAVSGSYGVSDLMGDATAFWSQVAVDSARAWVETYEVIQQIAESGLDPSWSADETTFPMPAGTSVSSARCGDLEGIEANVPPIRGSDVTTSLETLPLGDLRVRVKVRAPRARAGMYRGPLILTQPGGEVSQPIQIYVSQATQAG